MPDSALWPVRAMLWGFGDDVPDPNDCLNETVEALEDCVMDYIKSTVTPPCPSASGPIWHDLTTGYQVNMTVEHAGGKNRPTHQDLLQVSRVLKPFF